MLSRLPCFLGQLEAGNNSEKVRRHKTNYCITCINQKN